MERTALLQHLVRYQSAVEMADVLIAEPVALQFLHLVLAETEVLAAQLLVPLAVLGRHRESLVHW